MQDTAADEARQRALPIPGGRPLTPDPLIRAEAASTVTASEEARAFFQARLSVFGFCLFGLAGVSWVVLAAVDLFGIAPPTSNAHSATSIGSGLHLANALLAGGVWLATRRGRRSGPTLHAMDVGASVGFITIWGLAGALLPDPVVGGFVSLLSFILGTLARAIVVPSTGRRTLTIGVVGSFLIVAFTYWRAGPSHPALGGTIAAACWSASAVVIGWFASHTIFGLRREVQQTRMFGQYTLDAKLGEGSMGAVWRARHVLLRRPTALKLLPPARMGEAAIRRFEREVQLTARLTHPNTVHIFDYGRTRDGIFYYAMELLDGTDLERLVEQYGPQPPGRVVHVLAQICGALAEAHDLGLVHRDVKPANILLAPRRNEHEFAKIVDFGLVKEVQAKENDAALTATNTIAGTPLYMSPEAIRDPDSVDPRSDLYALGAVAWFMLVGRPVFEAASVVAVCGHHLHTPPVAPSTALQASIPSDLEDLILACLAKSPDDRPQDARALRTLLESCESATVWKASDATEWWRRHAPLVPSMQPEAGARTIALDLSTRASSPHKRRG